ncbi:MAG: tRNA (N(6)-L-threonylcarbamoyladenosine(37)-C(2))-methylthiotransferase MtaB [Nitrospirae bacterium]|nr:tRNA (N(6)-L-threonylcarbamoyladenosine(37)-C(2))-methylthiotransferase MtaB [Nitrospirota bacterium]
MKFCVLTLGCKANQAESSYIENLFVRNFHDKVTLDERPDICIINTCSVTAKSDYQSRQLIRRALKSGARVFATGCYSELNSKEIRSIGIDVEIIKNSQKILYFLEQSGLITEIPPRVTTSDRSRAFIKIQDGCNSSCSYCLIPQARGASRSVPQEHIIRESVGLEEDGFTEIVITGIHIGYYGVDLSPKLSLAGLIEAILKSTSTVRLRLTSLEATEIDEGIISLMPDERMCNHVHVPLQSGHDDILKAMNRPYDTNLYRATIGKLHGAVENLSIGSDVIVGFPGERDGHFLETLEFLTELPLSYLHVFPFSPRPNTRACTMAGQVEENVKKQRVLTLRNLSAIKKQKYMESQSGRVLEAVVEKVEGRRRFGTTGNYLKIAFNFDGAAALKKSLIKLIVTGYTESYLLGKPISGR